jgi:hypothetical protein
MYKITVAPLLTFDKPSSSFAFPRYRLSLFSTEVRVPEAILLDGYPELCGFKVSWSQIPRVASPGFETTTLWLMSVRHTNHSATTLSHSAEFILGKGICRNTKTHSQVRIRVSGMGWSNWQNWQRVWSHKEHQDSQSGQDDPGPQEGAQRASQFTVKTFPINSEMLRLTYPPPPPLSRSV